MRLARVDLLADALQACGKDERGAQVGVAGDVCCAALDAVAGKRHAQHVGAVVVAVGHKDRGPGRAGHAALAHQALVAVDGGGDGGADGRGVLEDAAGKPQAQLGEAHALEVFFCARCLKEVFARVDVLDAHVEVRARSGHVCKGLGHEACKVAVLADDLVCHVAEKHHAVGHREDIGVHEVDLKLAARVLVVKGVDVPAQGVHAVHELGEPMEVVCRGRHVVAGLVELVAVGDGVYGAVLIALEDKELGLDAQIQAVAHLGGGLYLTAQDVARASLKGDALVVEVAGKQRHVGAPGEDKPVRDIGVRRDFLVVDLLRDAVDGGAGVELGAFDHLVKVGEGHDLALDAAVEVGVAGEAVFDAVVLQDLLDLAGLVIKKVHGKLLRLFSITYRILRRLR